MPTDERLDTPALVDSYHRAVAAYQDQLAKQRKKRAAQAAAKKAAAAQAQHAVS